MKNVVSLVVVVLMKMEDVGGGDGEAVEEVEEGRWGWW